MQVFFEWLFEYVLYVVFSKSTRFLTNYITVFENITYVNQLQANSHMCVCVSMSKSRDVIACCL